MRRWVSLLLILALAGSGGAIYRIGLYLTYHRYAGDVSEEMMYFPSGELTEIASVGFESLASVLLWLRGIQYYGAHKRSDQYYVLAEHIYQVITDLDPHFLNAYRFGAFVISQDMGQPAGGVELLRKGIRHNYDRWELFFDLGFLYFVDVGDLAMAAHYFEIASHFPDAPDVARRFSAFAYKQAGKYEVSRKLWQEIYQSTDNQAMRDNALHAMKLLDLEESLSRLNDAMSVYAASRGVRARNLGELVDAGLVRRIPADPLGGTYFIDMGSGVVLSTTKVESEANRIARGLQEKIEYYRQIRGDYPPSLEALEEEKLITGEPVVTGAAFKYDAASGRIGYVLTTGSTGQ